mmetsp:Transcript_13073/g.12926  ORF Transcript_13073/g.12926 Transcript_13073/m.12926 type:complete len:146 (-) Transcript_13073:1815-2252(-)
MSDRIMKVINKKSGITEPERRFIFEYSQLDPNENIIGESIDKFAKNLIIIINSFFEFGFKEGVSFSGKDIKHYWDLITLDFGSYSSVSYINTQFGDSDKEEKCLCWLILVFNEQNLLYYCFNEIIQDQEFLSFYDEDSYFRINQE